MGLGDDVFELDVGVGVLGSGGHLDGDVDVDVCRWWSDRCVKMGKIEKGMKDMSRREGDEEESFKKLTLEVAWREISGCFQVFGGG
jgi:hypothetical protein